MTSFRTLRNRLPTLLGLLAVALLLAGTAHQPAAAQTIYGLEFSYGANVNSLLSFTAAAPGTILTKVPVTGIASGQTLVGIDFRPATGQLYALGYDATTQTGQLYLVNPTTAVVSPVGTGALALPLGTGTTSTTAPRIGFDFDPVADQVRLTSSVTQASLRLSPSTGGLVAADASLAYAAGDAGSGTTPGVGTVAYTNSYAGSRSTQLYAMDETTNRLLQAEPGSGALHTVGTIIAGTTYEYNPNKDLDFYYDPATATNIGYFTFSGYDPASGYAVLYRLDIATGQRANAEWIGPAGGYYEVRDIAVVPAGVVTATHAAELATNLALYPNPLASNTQLRFELPRAAHVQLTVTDALGRTIEVLDAGQLPAGAQAITWQRRQQAAGVYFFQLRFDGQPAGTRRGVLAD